MRKEAVLQSMYKVRSLATDHFTQNCSMVSAKKDRTGSNELRSCCVREAKSAHATHPVSSERPLRLLRPGELRVLVLKLTRLSGPITTPLQFLCSTSRKPCISSVCGWLDKRLEWL